MRRRRQERSIATPTAGHHNVYFVLLDDAVNGFAKVRRANPGRDPAKPSVYVGLTGLDPEQRLQNHGLGSRA
jgi:hypothetical protein